MPPPKSKRKSDWSIYWVGLAAAALLAFVFFNSSDDNIQKHASVVDRLRLLSQLDAQLRQDILKLRFGYMLDYDSVATGMAQSQKVLASLKKGPQSIFGKKGKEVDQKMETLEVVFKDEDEALTRFSSENTTLNNSLKYFPSLTETFIKKTKEAPETSFLAEKVESLLQNILLFSYTDSHNQELILDTERLLSELDAEAVSTESRNELNMIRDHAKIILSQTSEMQDVMGHLLATHATTTIDELSQKYFANHAIQSKKNIITRRLLFALCFFLILLVTEAVARLRQKTKSLDEININLEKRVDERTRELKKSERDLQARELRLRLIYDFSPLGICLANEKGENIYANRSFILISGYPEKEILGKGWEVFMHPEDKERVLTDWYNAVSKLEPYESTHRYIRKDKSVVWVHVLTAAVQQAGEATSYVAMVEDITEKKKLEAQLMQSQKMETVGTLAGGIAHDLNNQMTPLRGYLDILLQELKADPQNYPMILEASQAAVRCSDIVKRLLNFSKPSTSEDKKIIHVSELLEEMKRLFHSFLPATIQTEVLYEKSLHPVYGNETELQTVFMNLTTNARDAMPKGGKLRIEAKNSGPHVVILIADSGQGIPQEIIPKIFEPFFSTKDKSKGAGLGLAMVFGIVKSHHGFINVSSVVGQGSTFEIYLPASDTKINAPSSPAAQPAETKKIVGGNETILFVDDEKSLRDLGKTILERLGYKVLLACDGEEAVDILRQNQQNIAMVLMDMTMPKLTGKETMLQLLKINPALKIILATGFTTEGSTQELIGAGAKDLIQKPYTASTIGQKVRIILDR